jgi:hypothetical protein
MYFSYKKEYAPWKGGKILCGIMSGKDYYWYF